MTSCIVGLIGIKIQSPIYPFSGRQALGMDNSTWWMQPMHSGHGTEMMMMRPLIVNRSGWQAYHLTLLVKCKTKMWKYTFHIVSSIKKRKRKVADIFVIFVHVFINIYRLIVYQEIVTVPGNNFSLYII